MCLVYANLVFAIAWPRRCLARLVQQLRPSHSCALAATLDSLRIGDVYPSGGSDGYKALDVQTVEKGVLGDAGLRLCEKLAWIEFRWYWRV